MRRTRACREGVWLGTAPRSAQQAERAACQAHGQWALGSVSRVPLQGSRIPGQREGLRLLSVPERRRRDSRAARWFVTSRKHTFRETVIDLSPVSSGAKGLRRCPAISRRGVGASANTLLARRLVAGRAAFAPGQEQGQITWQAVLLCAPGANIGLEVEERIREHPRLTFAAIPPLVRCSDKAG